MAAKSDVLRYSYNVSRILALLAIYIVALVAKAVVVTGKRSANRVRTAGGNVVRGSPWRQSSSRR